jgi:serine/threonine protein kinase
MNATTPTFSRGFVFAGRFVIQEPLGRGGMGMVYKAYDRDLDEPVALKFLRPDIAQDSARATRRFRSEIKLARRVRHPNVCSIFGDGMNRGLLYICMEFVEGVDLRHLIGRRGGLPPAEAYGTAIQIADGLQAIHDVGVVHRDLKTANVMIDQRGAVRLMDFGIAKQWQSEAAAGATDTGQLIGTPEYMSPEQIRGEKVDHRSDIYALGIVVFETFTGRVPFRGDTPVATIFKHLQEAVPVETPEGRLVPAELRPVLQKALAKDPRERYDTVREIGEALQRAAAESGTGTARASLAGVRRPAPSSASVVTEDAAPTATDRATTLVAPTSRQPPTEVHRVSPRPWKAFVAATAIVVAMILVFVGRSLRGPSASRAVAEPPSTGSLVQPLPSAPTILQSVAPRPLETATASTGSPSGGRTSEATRVYLEDEVTPAPKKISGSVDLPASAVPKLKRGETISVVVSLVVTEKGDVTDIEIEQSGGAVWDAVILALSRWKYSPGRRAGVPVRTKIFRKINFRSGEETENAQARAPVSSSSPAIATPMPEPLPAAPPNRTVTAAATPETLPSPYPSAPQAAPSAAARQVLVHEAVGCMLPNQHPVIEATLDPSVVIKEARLYFRGAVSEDLFYGAMAHSGRLIVGTPTPWARTLIRGFLPKPTMRVGRVSYYIRVVAQDGEVFQTPIQNAMVAPAGQCPAALKVASTAVPPAGLTFYSVEGTGSLKKRLKGRTPEERRDAAQVLAMLGPTAKDAVPQLRDALNDSDATVRSAAVDALVKIGPTAIPVLLSGLQNADKQVRLQAAIGLGEIGEAASAAVPALRRALKDDDESVRLAAEKALRRIAGLP